MITASFIIVPSLIISHVHASYTSSGLLSIFRAYKTGILRVQQNDIDDEWLQHYQLLPTKESVDRIGQLLFKDSFHHPSHTHPEKGASLQNLFASAFTKALRCSLGCYMVKTPHNVLVVALRKKAGAKPYLAVGFLARYAIFKALLHQGLSKEEASVLMSISSEISLNLKYLLEIRRLVNDLTTPRCCADLLAALVSSINIHGICDLLCGLTNRLPDVMSNLVKEYIESSRRNDRVITAEFLSCLPAKSQYDLLRTKVFTWHPDLARRRSLYILSRFSESPSEEIQNLCLQDNPKCLVYEEATLQVKGGLLTRMKNLNPERLPKEIWIKILLYCNNFLFQIYTIPLVCESWKRLQHIVLSHSSTIQGAFMSDRNDALAVGRVFTCRRYPWNYFLRSPLTFFKYTLLCLESLRPEIGNQRTINQVEFHWQKSVQQISNDGHPMAAASYLCLYVRSCKAFDCPLEFHQPPSVSDEEYIELIRKCIYLHKIVPSIPKRFLDVDCRKLVRMLESDADLIVLLPKNDLQCHNRLAICLFLSKCRISPKVDKILCQASEPYRLLKNIGSSVILQNPAECSGADRLACGLDLESLRKTLQEYCFGLNNKDSTEYSELMASIKRELSLAIMTFLCAHCQDYSEDEFCTLQQFFESCGIFDQDSMSYAYRQHVHILLNDPKIATEFIY